jgi:hypothetical protein
MPARVADLHRLRFPSDDGSHLNARRSDLRYEPFSTDCDSLRPVICPALCSRVECRRHPFSMRLLKRPDIVKSAEFAQHGQVDNSIPFRRALYLQVARMLPILGALNRAGPHHIEVDVDQAAMQLTSPRYSAPIARHPASMLRSIEKISRGKTRYLHRIDAGFTKCTPTTADGGLRSHVPARPRYITPHIRFLFIVPQFRIGLPSDPASRRRPCPSPCLRLCENLAVGLSPTK